jgi:hypothetical protein
VGLGGTIPRLPTAQGIGSIGPVRGTAPGTPGRPRPGGPGSGSGSGGVAGGQPTLVDNVVSLGTSVTKNIPGPVGGLTTQVLQSLANTVDGMVPHAVESTTSPVTGLVKRVANSLHRS